ncbi:hypothetical protein [Sphingomonas nostoxanthinifaciens]|uniref:hypothetical protein n=1 Tax=Sphingomonas nostoxanthinifaciens TaxID=2872652 RepID=UPI001CC1E73C|nr:hypothetical protein [Sphingomonas nostoxanthinifaciens]UAK25884.1 hypothetical protein K8P63_07115 [Sphingomonas nostoxanthinifaciens]
MTGTSSIWKRPKNRARRRLRLIGYFGSTPVLVQVTGLATFWAEHIATSFVLDEKKYAALLDDPAGIQFRVCPAGCALVSAA